MKSRFSSSAFFVACLVACGTADPQHAAANSAAHYFAIHSADAALAGQALSMLMKAKSDTEAILGDTVGSRVAVHIVESREEFDRLTFGGLPDWGIGCAIPTRNLIVILSPSAVKYEQSFEEIIRHEWAHIALRHSIGNNYLPRFLDEGFAMHFAKQWNSGFSLTLARAQVFGSIFRLREIDRVNFFNASQAQIAYAQSYQAVSYLLNEYGAESFRMLLDGHRRGFSLDYVFEAAIGADFATFEREYSLHINRNYNWLLLLGDMWLLWIGLALLIVVGFILKKKRDRDMMKRWEEEEKYQSTDFDYEKGDPWD